MTPLSDCAVTEGLVKDQAIEALIRNGDVPTAVLDLTDHLHPTAVELAAANLIEAIADRIETQWAEPGADHDR